MIIKCREASRLQSDALDRDLTMRERFALRLHVLYCDACTRAGRQLRFLRRAVAEMGRRGEGR